MINRFTRIIAVLACSILLIGNPIYTESKVKSKAKTTATASRSKKAGNSKTTKNSKSNKNNKSSKGNSKTTKNAKSKQSTRRGWAPFASFETKATPSQYNVPADSIASLTRKAANGNVEAQYLLGCSYFERRVAGANRDSADYQAAKYWYMAAQQGHATAMGNYAYCLRTGRGVTADTLAAVNMYVASLKKGNPRLEKLTRQNADRNSAMDSYILARAIESGLKVYGNHDADYYDRIACSCGFAPAIVNEAQKELAAGNTDRAVQLLRSIHNPDDDTIDKILAMLRQAGSQDTEVLLNMASTGYPEAQLTLADILFERGESADAYKWMYQAAQNGSDTALEKLVRMLLNDSSSVYDPYQAYLWIDTYAEGNRDQINSLAIRLSGSNDSFVAYANGMALINVADHADFASALPLFKTSKTIGSNAMALLCEAKTINKSNAEKDLKKLADKQAPLAPMAYSILKPNDKTALKYLQAASKKGDISAKIQLGVTLYKKKDYKEAAKILNEVYENWILTEEAAIILSECDEKLSDK